MQAHLHRISGNIQIQDHEFSWIVNYLQAKTGIALSHGKQALVMGRLDKRLKKHHCKSYAEYFALLDCPGFEDETIAAIDLLTTNETYFFREPKHFEFIRQLAITNKFNNTLRIWSAASSSGEEAYSIAMVLAEHCRQSRWEILGSDISSKVLVKARRAMYPLASSNKIPTLLLKKYCLKGRDEYEDFFLIDRSLREKVEFREINLVHPFPDLGLFDVIFLRNVMIYFNKDTKDQLIHKLEQCLKPGGYFIVSHSETLANTRTCLRQLQPSIYQLVL